MGEERGEGERVERKRRIKDSLHGEGELVKERARVRN